MDAANWDSDPWCSSPTCFGLCGCCNPLLQQVSFSLCLKHPSMHLAPAQSVWPRATPNSFFCQTTLIPCEKDAYSRVCIISIRSIYKQVFFRTSLPIYITMCMNPGRTDGLSARNCKYNLTMKCEILFKVSVKH